MKEYPILFSGAVVRALVDGRKTQTRRVVKGFALELLQPDNFTPRYVALPENGNSPYGFAGDQLWVRETFFAYGRWETRYSENKARDEWHFVDMTTECDRVYQYAADEPDVPIASSRNGGVTPGWWKRPSIHMPRAASRALCGVIGVRIERLQDISEADAIAEGAYLFPAEGGGYKFARGEQEYDTAVEAYRHLWDSLNAARGFGWDANPWVWVVEVKRIVA